MLIGATQLTGASLSADRGDIGNRRQSQAVLWFGAIRAVIGAAILLSAGTTAPPPPIKA
jgi:hypothetical protein